MSHTHRTALTLVELVVCIAIVGVLAALVLPAVQRSREASRRVDCQNNLRQVGLALAGFESHQRRLPAGRDAKYGRQHSWATAVLPYLEQTDLHSAYDWDQAWNSRLTCRSPTPTSTCSAALIGISQSSASPCDSKAPGMSDGTAVDLNTLIDPDSGWHRLTAQAVSDTGWIAGLGRFDPDGPLGQDANLRPFLVHVPEVSAFASIPGDYNGNGIVEPADLDLVFSHWGSSVTPASRLAAGVLKPGSAALAPACVALALTCRVRRRLPGASRSARLAA